MKNLDIFFIPLLIALSTQFAQAPQTVSPNIKNTFVGVYSITTTSYGATSIVWNSNSYTLLYPKEAPTTFVD